MRAVVTGMIATYPVGGVAWDYGQYAIGLEDLGFEVFYLEDTGGPTYDPSRMEYGNDCRYGLNFLKDSLGQLSPQLAERWHFCAVSGDRFGIEFEQLKEVIASADLFLNVSGGTLLRDEYMSCRCKVLIDTDPGWNHFVNYPRWDANPGWQGTHGFRAHDYFFTYAERLGQADCVLPSLDLNWQTTRPLVVFNRWKAAPPGKAWTTVMTWNNFQKPVEHGGRVFGTKEMEFQKIESMPVRRPKINFELATGGTTAPIARWREIGWRVVDSHFVSETLVDYRDYLERSRGELSVAKNLYVATHSGWFSCRSACYLAAGRPVVVQDTGFSQVLPTGSGLFAFATEQEAINAIDAVESNYSFHSAAAREFASEFLDARRVLSSILERVGLR